MKNKDKNKTKFSLSALLNNNRILMVISLIIAFGVWIWVAIEKSPEVQKVVSGVPVSINMSNSIPQHLGLQIFGESEFTVDVSVTGKKYVLSALDKNDISVEANLNYVDSPGIKTLQLKISPKNESDDFVITSSSSNYIEVYFDTYKEIELPLNGEISSNLETVVPDECLLGDIVFSKPTVKISGPATEINRIVKVNATVSVDSVLEKTTTFDPEITLVTNDGSSLQYSKIITENGDITMTVPVLKIMTLPTRVEFKNAPSYYVSNPLSYSVSPSYVKVAVPVDAVETTKYFIVDSIDFADISNSINTFNIDASSISSFKIMDESVKRFRVRINASDLSAKTVTVPVSQIRINNTRSDFTVKSVQDRDISVTVIGTAEAIEKISAENILIEVDTADKTISGDTKVIQGKVVISDDGACWASGKYDVKVTVSAVE